MTSEKTIPVRYGISVFYACLSLFWLGTTGWNIYGWHDQQRIAEIVLLFVMYSLQLTFFLYKDPQVKSVQVVLSHKFLITFLFSGLALCGVLSVINADYPHWAALEWALLLSICAGIFTVARFRGMENGQFDRIILFIIVGVCLILLMGFLARYATLLTGVSLRISDMFEGFSNLRFFGQLQTMTLPLLVVVVMTTSSRLQKWGFFFLLSSWWMLSIASGTRGTWLAIFIAMIAVWLVGRSTGWRWMQWQIGGIVVGLMLYGLMFFVIPTWLNIQLQLINRLPSLTSLSLRDVLWVDAWHMICAHPWFGVGPMHFAAKPNGIGAHPHNAILQIAAEWGMPALLMLLTLVVLGFYRLIKYLRAQRDETSFANILNVALFAALVAAGVQSLVDGVIVMPYTQVTLMVLVGWTIGICSSSFELKGQPTLQAFSRWREFVFLGFSALLLGTVILLGLPDVPQLQERMQRYTDKYHTTYFNPRFWQQGWINE